MAALLTTLRKGTPWEATPWGLFREIDREFLFTLDVCASARNTKCRRFYSEADDALSQPWAGETCWMNPPFRGAGCWVERAWRAARVEGATVVCLLPVWSDVAWWHDWALRCNELRFFRGRVRFNGAKAAAPMALCLAIFRPGPDPEGGPRVLGVAVHDRRRNGHG